MSPKRISIEVNHQQRLLELIQKSANILKKTTGVSIACMSTCMHRRCTVPPAGGSVRSGGNCAMVLCVLKKFSQDGDTFFQCQLVHIDIVILLFQFFFGLNFYRDRVVQFNNLASLRLELGKNGGD